MVTPTRPEFMKWINVTIDGWELKEDAPKWVKEELEKFIENLKMVDEVE